MKRDNTLSNILLFIGTLLIIGSLVLCIYNIKVSEEAARKSHDAVIKVRESIEEIQNLKTSEPENTDDEAEQKEVYLDGSRYIGILSIPVIDMELPVMSDCSLELLKTSPCRYYGEVDENLVIAGHNYKSGQFGELKKVRVGDEVFLEDALANVHSYVIGEIEVLQPQEVERMTDSDWDLSLYTCTYGGTQRLTVRCEELQ